MIKHTQYSSHLDLDRMAEFSYQGTFNVSIKSLFEKSLLFVTMVNINLSDAIYLEYSDD